MSKKRKGAPTIKLTVCAAGCDYTSLATLEAALPVRFANKTWQVEFKACSGTTATDEPPATYWPEEKEKPL